MVDTPSQPPKGFSVVAQSADDLAISYKSTGMGCLLAFLVIGNVSVTAGFVVAEVANPGATRALLSAAWWTPLAFAAMIGAIVHCSCFVAFHAFGTMTILASDHGVVINRSLWGLSRTRYIPRDDVRYLEQIQDGGEGDDTFPSWGLRLVGWRKCSLLSRQPIDKSDWLGRFLAQQLGVEYRPTDKRPVVDDDGK